jgi:mannose-6-phosphate isomerase-like protein (cupin superfamily)
MVIHSATRPWPQEPGQVGCFSKDLATSSETQAMSAHHLRIEPGCEFKSHSHGRETELHFVISGYGQALDGDKWEDVVPGDVVLSLPGSVHALRNPTPDPLFILCVFSPPLY